MDVSKPEILERQMYQATGEMAVERPIVEQDNDIDAPFDISVPVGIPLHLQQLIQQPESVDVETAEEPVEFSIDPEKVHEENPQSRFKVINSAILKPGVCALCGSAGGDGRQFVDFGKTVDFFGCVYFCTFCVTEAAKLLGLKGSDSEHIQNLNNSLSEFDGIIWDLKAKLNAAMVLLRNCTCSSSGVDIPVVEVIDSELVESDDGVGSSESSDSDESNADESATEPGPDDIPANSGDNESTTSSKPVRRARKSNG